MKILSAAVPLNYRPLADPDNIFRFPWRNNVLLLASKLPVSTNFRVEVNIHFILVKCGMLSTALGKRFGDNGHFLFFMWVPNTQCWRCFSPEQSSDEPSKRASYNLLSHRFLLRLFLFIPPFLFYLPHRVVAVDFKGRMIHY